MERFKVTPARCPTQFIRQSQSALGFYGEYSFCKFIRISRFLFCIFHFQTLNWWPSNELKDTWIHSLKYNTNVYVYNCITPFRWILIQRENFITCCTRARYRIIPPCPWYHSLLVNETETYMYYRWSLQTYKKFQKIFNWNVIFIISIGIACTKMFYTTSLSWRW